MKLLCFIETKIKNHSEYLYFHKRLQYHLFLYWCHIKTLNTNLDFFNIIQDITCVNNYYIRYFYCPNYFQVSFIFLQHKMMPGRLHLVLKIIRHAMNTLNIMLHQRIKAKVTCERKRWNKIILMRT